MTAMNLHALLEADPNVDQQFVEGMTRKEPNMAEAIEAPLPSTDPRANCFTTSARLRELAEWIDRHGVKDAEVVCMSGTGWNDMQAHLTLDGARRIWPGRVVPLDNAGYAHLTDEGVAVVFYAVPKGVAAKEVTL